MSWFVINWSCTSFLFSVKGVPGEGGAAGATGPRVSWQSVFNFASVWITDCQTCRWLSLCRRSGRAWFPRRERSCRLSGSAGTSRSAWNSWNWRAQGESSIWSKTRRRQNIKSYRLRCTNTTGRYCTVVLPPVRSYHMQQQQLHINVSMILNNNNLRCLWVELCCTHSVFSPQTFFIWDAKPPRPWHILSYGC